MTRVRRWIRPSIQASQPYTVAQCDGMLKLDAMESPYSWGDDMRREWMEVLRSVDLNLYPDSRATAVKQRLRQVMGIPDATQVLLGNGSDELIQITQTAVGGTDCCVLAPEPTFSMYKVIAATIGLGYIHVPLGAEFTLNVEQMCDAIVRRQPAAVFLAYPNNPTGNLFERSDLEEIISATDGLVVLDEAYYPFSGQSFIPDLADYDNVVVMRSLSKFGMAGLRLGFLVGPTAWLSQLEKVRLPYNINALTQASVDFALSRVEVFNRQVELICEQRQSLVRELSTIAGIKVFPSHTNFVLFRIPDASAVFQGLKKAGILIKCLDEPGSALQDCLRVTVGRPEDVQAFITTLRGIV
ncbi:MAG: histidinol-phosphate transaminase [Gammaproteobacteria bacterium]|nr:histidinol-phosphate transaminase [Gammaproteobacteria bacterium]